MLHCVMAKLGNMRKPQEFTVYPFNKVDGTLTIQSDKSIGTFDANTGKGLLNTKGCYFPHLTVVMGAKPYQFPMELVQECKKVAGLTEHSDILTVAKVKHD